MTNEVLSDISRGLRKLAAPRAGATAAASALAGDLNTVKLISK